MQKAWQARTFVDAGQASPGQHLWPQGGGLEPADCAGVGFGAIWAGGFLPAGGCKTVWQGACFRGRGVGMCDPKVILGAKTRDPKGDAY